MTEDPTLFSIGYGNRTIGAFIDLLRSNGIRLLVDVRSKPFSRFQPDFDRRRLPGYLAAAGIGYAGMGEALGGQPRDPACYTDGRVDYTKLAATPAFVAGLDDVCRLGDSAGPLALMCAELKPQACHRARLIGEALKRRGVGLVHIDESGTRAEHQAVMERVPAQRQGDLFA